MESQAVTSIPIAAKWPKLAIPERRTPAWLWPNLLSLDAPLVALLWQILFARCFHASLGILPMLLLVMTVWLIYTADRALDAWRGQESSPRHVFYKRHWKPLAPLWLLVIGLTAWLAIDSLPRVLFQNGLLLLGAVIVYLLLVHGTISRETLRFGVGLKEAAVGAVFAIGASLAVWSKVRTVADAFTILLFAGLCWLNCEAIRLWENDRANTRRRILAVTRAALFLCGCSCALLFLNRPVLGGAEIASACGLLALHFTRRHLSVNALRVLADVALLTPLIFLPMAGV